MNGKSSVSSRSFLLVTIDSCRYDTYTRSRLPNLRSVAPIHKAYAPSYFTYGSHAAIFVGFTPGVPSRPTPFLNPKFGKIFKLSGAGFPGKGREVFVLEGRNIIDALNRQGVVTIGTSGLGWFDPSTSTGATLVADFQHFWFAGNTYSLPQQVEWLLTQIQAANRRDMLVFLNVGETHVPYYFSGADWDPAVNPCVPFATDNDREVCEYRQQACLEYVDRVLEPLTSLFFDASILICSDHGDCWGEDGLWEHGIHHPATLTVPLQVRITGSPIE